MTGDECYTCDTDNSSPEEFSGFEETSFENSQDDEDSCCSFDQSAVSTDTFQNNEVMKDPIFNYKQSVQNVVHGDTTSATDVEAGTWSSVSDDQNNNSQKNYVLLIDGSANEDQDEHSEESSSHPSYLETATTVESVEKQAPACVKHRKKVASESDEDCQENVESKRQSARILARLVERDLKNSFRRSERLINSNIQIKQLIVNPDTERQSLNVNGETISMIAQGENSQDDEDSRCSFVQSAVSTDTFQNNEVMKDPIFNYKQSVQNVVHGDTTSATDVGAGTRSSISDDQNNNSQKNYVLLIDGSANEDQDEHSEESSSHPSYLETATTVESVEKQAPACVKHRKKVRRAKVMSKSDEDCQENVESNRQSARILARLVERDLKNSFRRSERLINSNIQIKQLIVNPDTERQLLNVNGETISINLIAEKAQNSTTIAQGDYQPDLDPCIPVKKRRIEIVHRYSSNGKLRSTESMSRDSELTVPGIKKSSPEGNRSRKRRSNRRKRRKPNFNENDKIPKHCFCKYKVERMRSTGSMQLRTLSCSPHSSSWNCLIRNIPQGENKNHIKNAENNDKTLKIGEELNNNLTEYRSYFTRFIVSEGQKVRSQYINGWCVGFETKFRTVNEAERFVESYSEYHYSNYLIWRNPKKEGYILHRTWICAINGPQDSDTLYQRLLCPGRIDISVKQNSDNEEFNANVIVCMKHSHNV